MTELGRALDEVAGRLAAAGIAEARREARLLAAEATGLSAATVIAHPERELNSTQWERLSGFTRRREGREPISRILGWREFWSLRFALGPETFDPRPDSETLIEACGRMFSPCCGSVPTIGAGSLSDAVPRTSFRVPK